jgi:hypothetical protein
MAEVNKKISELPPAENLNGNEEVELLQLGGNVKATLTKIKNWLLGFFRAKRPTVYKSASFALSKDTDYVVDSSGGEIVATLPVVTAGDDSEYYITLQTNSNHCNIQVDGVQQMSGFTIVSLSTVNARIILKANGVDGYDILSDEREYYRIIEFTTDLPLLTGIESGGRYEGVIPDATEVTVTVQDWSAEHIGDTASFTKISGVNSTIRVVSEDSSFDEIITQDKKGFKLIYGKQGFGIGQDSRVSEPLVAIDFYPTITASVLEPGYKLLVNNTADPAYPPVPGVDFSTPPITSEIEQSIGFYINDLAALRGLVSERGINAYARVKLNVSSNRAVAIKFNYYEYTISTNTLNPTPIATTGFSEFITLTVYNEKIISGVLPANDWTDKTLVIELLAKKSATGGDNPVLDLLFGGATPSKTSINVPAASVGHDTLAGVSDAGVGVSKGHVDSDLFKDITAFQTNYTSTAAPAPTGDYGENELYITALAVAATFAAPSGTPFQGNTLFMRIKDNNTAQSLLFDPIYRGMQNPLPPTTIAGKYMRLAFEYNATDSKWDLIGTDNEA